MKSPANAFIALFLTLINCVTWQSCFSTIFFFNKSARMLKTLIYLQTQIDPNVVTSLQLACCTQTVSMGTASSKILRFSLAKHTTVYHSHAIPPTNWDAASSASKGPSNIATLQWKGWTERLCMVFFSLHVAEPILEILGQLFTM